MARWIGLSRIKRDDAAPIEIEANYDAVFQLIRRRASDYIAFSSEIVPDDELVRPDRFGRDDVSYFATNLQKALNLSIPDSEWARVYTFDDMTKLLVGYLQERKIKSVGRYN